MSASDAPSSNEPAPEIVNTSVEAVSDTPAPAIADAPPVTADAPAPDSLAPGTADEMIAQAAGSQIDDLLAKADVERPAQDSDVPAVSAPVTATAIPSAPAEPRAEKPAQEQSAPAPIIENQPAINETSAKGKPEAAAVGAGEPSPVQNAQSQPIESETDAVSSDEQNDQDPPQEQSPSPAWLIPLQLINHPFESIPDSIRSALGKAAILTLFNATALLIYVFKFRKIIH